MIRFLFRLVGLALLAAAFAMAVIDGTASVAARAVHLTPLGRGIEWALPGRIALWQTLIERNIHPLLWDPMLLTLLRLPGFLILALLGVIVMWAARRPAPKIGYSSRP